MKRELGPDSLVSVLVPIYNEAESIESFVREVHEALAGLHLPGQFELVLCDDGSRDGSAEKLDDMAARFPGEVRVIHLARNFGHAAALAACIEHARGEIVIVMDGDMQDDPAAFRQFFTNWSEGYDVVYAIRSSREEHAALRLLFWLFYRMLNWMVDFDLPLDAGNFGLMDRVVVNNLRRMRERNIYLPGLRAWIGFRQIGVPVPRRARYDRKTRVGVRGLWMLAANAVFSFANVPLFVFRVASITGMLVAMLVVVWALVSRDRPLLAAARNLAIIGAFFTAVVFLGVGLLVSYAARIYDEIRDRPRYIVSRITEVARANATRPKGQAD